MQIRKLQDLLTKYAHHPDPTVNVSRNTITIQFLATFKILKGIKYKFCVD